MTSNNAEQDQSVYSNANITCTRCMQYFATYWQSRADNDEGLTIAEMVCIDYSVAGIMCHVVYHVRVSILSSFRGNHNCIMYRFRDTAIGRKKSQMFHTSNHTQNVLVDD